MWLEHGVLRRATLVDNFVGFLGRNATLDSALVVGQTANALERPWQQMGVSFYVDRAHVEDVAFANFRPAGRGPVVALGHFVETNIGTPSIRGLSFTNADRLAIQPARDSGALRNVSFDDLDGSVNPAGVPAAITALHPLLVTPACTPLPLLGAAACPPTDRFGFLKVESPGGGSQLVGAQLRPRPPLRPGRRPRRPRRARRLVPRPLGRPRPRPPDGRLPCTRCGTTPT